MCNTFLIVFLLWQVCPWICVVRSVIGEKILHETIFTFCVDSCSPINGSYPVLFDYSKYVWRPNLVYNAHYDGGNQRLYGLHVWFFLWKNPTYSTKSQKNLGRFYWWWNFNSLHYIGFVSFCLSVLLLGLPYWIQWYCR